jgi:large subunit ribosomal protein L6
MSRIAKNPITIPAGVDVKINDNTVQVKGPKGTLTQTLHSKVDLVLDNGTMTFNLEGKNDYVRMQSGTARALINNLVQGVSKGYERKLMLVGVGYRAAVQGSTLNLTLGYSHPINFPIPQGIQIETPTQTEILVKGIDKQLVGQVSANIRAYRRPEPYKGKGIRYSDEVIIQKETKKKK